MLLFGINLMILTALFFIAGMIKPKWPLFFLDRPTRFMILVITTILVMISITMYGEGLKERKEQRELAAKPSAPKTPAIAPVPQPIAPEAAKP